MTTQRDDRSAARTVVCARCGANFGCGLGGPCWCADEAFRLPVPTAGSTEDCLCPTCLRAAAATLAHG